MLKLTQLVGFMRGGEAPPGEDIITWSQSDKSANMTVYGTDIFAQSPSSTEYTGVRATHGRSAGKRYFEIVAADITNDSDFIVGLASSGTALNSGPSVSNALLYRGNGQSWDDGATGPALATLATEDVVGIAIDFATGKVWLAKNNSWQASGDPAAGTNEIGTQTAGERFPIALTDNGSGSQIFRLATREEQFAYSPPAGFVSWATP